MVGVSTRLPVPSGLYINDEGEGSGQMAGRPFQSFA